MRDYLRVLGLLRPHRARLAALVVCIVVASSLSSVGITFISPLLRILFSEPPATEQVVPSRADEVRVEAETPSAESNSAAEGIPLPASIEAKKDALLGALQERLYEGDRRQQLWRVCLWLLVLFAAKNLFTFLQEVLRVQLEHRVIYDIRQRLYRCIVDLPLGFFSGERTGYMMSRVIIDVDMMRGAIVGTLTVLVSNLLMVLIALGLALLVSWQLFLTTLLVVPPNMLLVGWISRRLRRGSHRVQEEMGETAAVLQETISGVRVVKAFDTEGRESGRFERSNRRYYKAYVKLKVTEALSSPVSEMLGIVTAIIIIGFGGRLVLEGRLAPDLLFLFLAVMLWVITPIKNLIKANSTLQQSLAAARRVFEIFDATKETADAEAGARDVAAPREAIAYENVGFAYRADVPVLHDVDLRVGAGEVVALVGASGAGKSTLVDLVPRFYTPTSGRVTWDGRDLQEFHLASLRSLIGIVSQEVILFHDTVAANVAYGQEGVSRERIEAAARTANAHEFIAELAQGYDTVIGERGIQLSGGQRQRLAIARAVLKNPPVLILDEATSALDSESEQQVQQAMERLMEGRTTLVIAHRLSTVRKADRIVVMDRGRIVEQGTHDELFARRGAYRRLHDLQFRGSGPGDSPELVG